LEITSSEGGISTDLEIKLDGNPLLLTTTNPSGWSSIQFDIDNQFTLGHHVLTILYNGSERYMDTFLVNEFDILSPMGIEIMVPSYPVIGTETSMVVSLYDTFTRPLEGTLTITDLSNGYNMSIQIPEDSIDINIAISFSGPVGLHNLLIEVNNQFVINPSRIQNITIWAQPVISLQNSNILHYASPRQEITFVLNLTNWSNKISFQSVHLLCNGNLLVSSTTNDEGIVSLSTLAPEDEGLYNLSVIYSMNLTRYELPAKLDYSLIVTLLMPVQVELDYYEVIPPLQKISIYLHAWCLNGSQVEGIPITISWQSSETSIVTDQDGLLIIDLTVPEYSGNYTLSYSLEQDHKLASTSGTISILITLTDVLTSQGIGINGFVFGFLAIFTIFAVPVIRQKYLIM